MNVILLAAISADGKIAQREDQTSLDWTSKEDTKFFVEKTKEVGVVIMGSKTFETIGKPLNGRRVVVLSREEKAEMGEKADGTVEFVNISAQELIARLEKEGHDSVVVAGGASVYSQFLRAGLVTELYLTIEPVLFGNGIPFASGFNRINLKLVEVRPFGLDAVLLHFQT